MRKHRPEILHLHYTGFLGPYPWIARLMGVKKVFFTDHGSKPEGYVQRRKPMGKRFLSRAVNLPLDGIVCVSDYIAHDMRVRDLMFPSRVHRVYNGVDMAAVGGDGAQF